MKGVRKPIVLAVQGTGERSTNCPNNELEGLWVNSVVFYTVTNDNRKFERVSGLCVFCANVNAVFKILGKLKVHRGVY